MAPPRCSASITIAPGRAVRCQRPADHEPADVHHGLLRVVLPDGRDQAASLAWGSTIEPHDEVNLRRAE